MQEKNHLAMNSQESKRFHFTPQLDIQLLRVIVADPPFAARHGNVQEKWEAVQSRMSNMTGWKSLRDRFGLLVKQFKAQSMIQLRKSGTEEEYTERDKLLEEICELLAEEPKAPEKPKQLELSMAVRDHSMRTLKEKNAFLTDESSSSSSPKKRKDMEIISLLKSQDERLHLQTEARIAIDKAHVENEKNRILLEDKRMELDREKLRVDKFKFEVDKFKFEEDLQLRQEDQRLAHEEKREIIALLRSLASKSGS